MMMDVIIMVIILVGFALGFVYFTTASWPLYIDLVVFGLAILAAVPCVALYNSEGKGAIFVGKCVVGGMAGAVTFILMFFWCGLSLSIWWYILAVVIGIFTTFIPVGFTAGILLCKKAGLIFLLPKWVLIVVIAIDVIGAIMYVQALTAKRRA